MLPSRANFRAGQVDFSVFSLICESDVCLRGVEAPLPLLLVLPDLDVPGHPLPPLYILGGKMLLMKVQEERQQVSPTTSILLLTRSNYFSCSNAALDPGLQKNSQ